VKEDTINLNKASPTVDLVLKFRGNTRHALRVDKVCALIDLK